MERFENGVKSRRAAILEIAEDPEAQSILADEEGVIVDFFMYRDDEVKNKGIRRYSERGWGTLDVGKWTVFHIDREEFSKSVEPNSDVN